MLWSSANNIMLSYSSLLSWYCRWMNGLFKKGYDRRLEPDDLYEVLEEDSSETVANRLEQ